MDKKTDVRDPDEKVVEIEMERLRAFPNHPFKVIGDSQMIELQDSIKKYGVLNPLIVRPKIEGYYEIISGHRRKYAAEKLGYKKIPVIIRMLQDDEAVDTNGSGHGALAGVLNALNADVLICGGIGGGAQTALAAAGIKLFGGVSGDADKAVEAFINDTLDYNPDVKCSHHEHSHGEGHTCGEHGCGNHSCH